MIRTRVILIALIFVAMLILAVSTPAGAYDGASASASASSSTGIYAGWSGGGCPYNYQYQQWQSHGWGSQYPWYDNYQGGGYFSDCYSRCISQGYGPNYCVRACPV